MPAGLRRSTPPPVPVAPKGARGPAVRARGRDGRDGGDRRGGRRGGRREGRGAPPRPGPRPGPGGRAPSSPPTTRTPPGPGSGAGYRERPGYRRRRRYYSPLSARTGSGPASTRGDACPEGRAR
ncbi:hypothetical protein GFH48_13335 [Streptomyces fagopyri]|uniref:Uncharacterized protein n=1 Tax=Streptomyces fagopyri TaxID=2662397 RepID=A0A5Q0LAN4_9ACTN|nr:hypothetical protein GFH48_13335 [Streptomyces fagopyri]